jgi:hypothetical protein
MPHVLSRLVVAGLACVLAAPAVAASAAPHRPPAPVARATLLVGAASRSVLPLVDGSLDYLGAGFPGRDDPYDPGIVVPEWDDGRIAVGNSDDFPAWVHDDIRVAAMAVDDPRSADLVMFVSTDLYMVFRADAEEIRTKAAALPPPGIAARARIVVTASHQQREHLHARRPGPHAGSVAQDMMDAVAAIIGNADPTEVNPDFPGWWQGFLPPGPLP